MTSNRALDILNAESMNTPNVIYTALFVDDGRLLTQLFVPRHEIVLAHHTTIAFRPGSLDGIEIGKRQQMKIIGRVTDEKADALLVENPKSTNKYPHITLSTMKGVPPTYANEMIEQAKKEHLFELFHEPTIIDVTEGYFNGTSDIVK
jgi:hypothetical protein